MNSPMSPPSLNVIADFPGGSQTLSGSNDILF